jgi:hypothetical protein
MTQSSTCPGSLVANVSMPWQVLPPLAPRKMPPKARDSTRPNPGPSARESRGANGCRVSRGRFRVVGCGAFRLDFDGWFLQVGGVELADLPKLRIEDGLVLAGVGCALAESP